MVARRKRRAQRMAAAPAASEPSTVADRPADVGPSNRKVQEAMRSGQPMPADVESRVEAAFGHDFRHVRIHASTAAAEAAEALNARAFALGSHVFFGAGQWAPGTPAGDRLLAHELTHVQQFDEGRLAGQSGVSHPSDPAEQEAYHHEDVILERLDAIDAGEAEIEGPGLEAETTREGPAVQRDKQQGGPRPPSQQQGTPLTRRPEDCPTYEMWLSQFRNLPQFQDDVTGDQVLGDDAADPRGRREAHDPDRHAPEPYGRRPTDRFIDHPTDQWVRDNLPEELRILAYQLPADCADVSFILRHVWLSAHGRSEVHSMQPRDENGRPRGNPRRMEIGAALGQGRSARQRQDAMDDLTSGGRNSRQVSSGNMQDMVQAYRDDRGQVVRSQQEVVRRLHPGDILVWEHYRPDGINVGHVNTVEAVEWSGGTASRVTVVEGDQPIGPGEAQTIRSEERHARREPPETSDLRNAPGRRVQRDVIPLTSSGPIWEFTVPRSDGTHRYALQVAGPPRAAQRPTGGTGAVSDWVAGIRGATNRDQLFGRVEAALQELRAEIEGGDAPRDHAAVARDIGAVARERANALEAQDRGIVQQLREVIQALGGRDARGRPDSRIYGPGAEDTGANTPNPRFQEVGQTFDTVLGAYDATR